VKAFRDKGVVLAVAIVVAGTALVGAARPAAVLASSYSDQEYALDALALEYLGDYLEDPTQVQRISRQYWCGTPVLQQLEHIPRTLTTEVALRTRALGMAQRAVR
jgi:hypothetical protein